MNACVHAFVLRGNAVEACEVSCLDDEVGIRCSGRWPSDLDQALLCLLFALQRFATEVGVDDPDSFGCHL